MPASELAQAIKQPQNRVYALLRKAPWWTEELAAASRLESYRWYQEQLGSPEPQGMEKARSARPPGSTRRKLSRQAVQEIRKRAIAVDSLSACAYNEMVLLWLRQRNQTA